MKLQLSERPSHHNYSLGSRSVIPGLLIGSMFLLAAFAHHGTSEQTKLLRQIQSANVQAGTPSRMSTVIRLPRTESADSDVTRPIRSVDQSIADGIRLTTERSERIPSDRVTLQVPFAESPEGSGQNTRQELLTLLSRRMSSLELQLTLRVPPNRLPEALKLAEELAPGSAISAFGVSVDSSITKDTLFVDVIRSAQIEVAEGGTR